MSTENKCGSTKLLKNMNFEIKPGETVALVGSENCGKSTIIKLLMRKYDLINGSITIDGVNINDLDKESIRGNITIINQNPYIFNLSIRDNLKLVKVEKFENQSKVKLIKIK